MITYDHLAGVNVFFVWNEPYWLEWMLDCNNLLLHYYSFNVTECSFITGMSKPDFITAIPENFLLFLFICEVLQELFIHLPVSIPTKSKNRQKWRFSVYATICARQLLGKAAL